MYSGGVARNAEGKLAGSTLTLDRALRNMVALGVPFASALRMLTARSCSPSWPRGAAREFSPRARTRTWSYLDDRLEIAGVMTKGAGLELA